MLRLLFPLLALVLLAPPPAEARNKWHDDCQDLLATSGPPPVVTPRLSSASLGPPSSPKTYAEIVFQCQVYDHYVTIMVSDYAEAQCKVGDNNIVIILSNNGHYTCNAAPALLVEVLP